MSWKYYGDLLGFAHGDLLSDLEGDLVLLGEGDFDDDKLVIASG